MVRFCAYGYTAFRCERFVSATEKDIILFYHYQGSNIPHRNFLNFHSRMKNYKYSERIILKVGQLNTRKILTEIIYLCYYME